MASSPTYTFYIKKTSEADSAYVQKQSGTGTTCSFTGLLQNTSYTVKVTTKDIAGNTGTGTKAGTTGTVETPTITVENPSVWSTSKKVTITTKTGYTTKYTTNGTKPSKDNGTVYKEEFTVNSNCTITAIYLDSTNQVGSGTTNTISKIDTIAPLVNEVTKNTSSSLTVKATDEASGIVGYAITQNTNKPSSYTTCNSTKTLDITFNNLQPSTNYYVWLKDQAGNESYKDITTHDITDQVVYTLNPATWTNGTVKVTVSFPLSGYTLKVRKTETASWSTTLTQSYTANGTIFVQLTQTATGKVYTTQKDITNIDKTKPVVTGVTDITYTTAKVTATDEASGVASYAYSTSTTTPSASSFKAVDNPGSLETQVTITGLSANKTYYVWVKDTAGNTSASFKFATATDKTKPIVTGVTDITYTTAKVTATDEASGVASYAYSTSTTTPSASSFKAVGNPGSLETQVTITGLTHNKTYYVWAKDIAGNISARVSFKTLADTTKPRATIEYDKTTTITLAAKVTHIDNETGINIAKCKWIFNTSSTALGTTASKYTGGTFTENGETITYAIPEEGTYYLHILTIDNAGNAAETISGAVKVVTTKAHTHVDSCYETVTEKYLPSGNNCNDCSNLGWVGEENGENVYSYKCNCCGSTFTGTNGWHHCTASKHYQTRKVKKLICGKTTIETCIITYL